MGGDESPFWVERLSREVGLTRLVTSVGFEEEHAPYILVLVATLFERPVPSAFDHLRGNTELVPFLWWRWPGMLWWLIPASLVLAVLFLQVLRKRHDRAVREVIGSHGGGDVTASTFSPRLLYGTLLLGLLIYIIWLSTALPQLLESNPIYTTVRWGLIVPLVYVPIATDLTAAYIRAQLLLPLEIREAGVELDFSDPRRLGGMYPVGRVMQLAALAAYTALTIHTLYWYAGFTVLPAITPPADRTGVLVIFVLTWTLSTATLVIGVYLVHGHMQSYREEQIDRVLDRIRALDGGGEVFIDTTPQDEAEHQAYLQEYIRLDMIERTRTVPFNVVVTWELVAGALIPVLFQCLTILI